MASAFEALVVVTEGDVLVGDGEAITAGQATVVAGDVELRTEDGSARVLVAAIGSEIPAGPVTPVDESTPIVEDDEATGTSRIIVLTALCPAGVTTEQAQDTSQGDPCFGGPAVEDMTVQFSNTETEGFFETPVDPANASARFDGLPPGNYNVIFATGTGLGETVGVCGRQDGSADLDVVPFAGSSVNLGLPADDEYLCVTRTVQLGEVSTDGVIAATFFACPNGMTFDTLAPSQCEVVTEGFDFGFQGDAGTELHLADAEFADGAYLCTGLTINPDPNSGVVYPPIVCSFPAGSDAYGISAEGGDILLPPAGGFALTVDQQTFTLAVYFFTA